MSPSTVLQRVIAGIVLAVALVASAVMALAPDDANNVGLVYGAF